MGNVSHLLDYAILGFPKCGTTSIQGWFGDHPKLSILKVSAGKGKPDTVEPEFLLTKQPLKFVGELRKARKILSNNSTSDRVPLLGYKQPGDIFQRHVYDYLGKHWPAAKIIVAVRHPIQWFESYLNWRHPNGVGNQTLRQMMAPRPRKELSAINNFPLNPVKESSFF